MARERLVERDFSTFFQVPFVQYGEDQVYVSPFRSDLEQMLDGSRNPAFGGPDEITYYTFVRDGRPVGRIAAHVHAASNRRFGTRRGSFGFFDCADDPHAARALLDAAGEWLLRRGCDEMAGNFNLTAMQEMGVVVEGHDEAPFTAQHHNPAWIPGLLEINGFEPSFPMTTWSVDLNRVEPDDLLGPKQQAILDAPELTFSPIRRRRFRRSMRDTWELLNASFHENPLFVPMTWEEFFFQAEQMRLVFDPRIAFMARREGEPVGVVACIPDANPLLRATESRLKLSTPLHWARFRSRRRRASVIFGGIAPSMQNRGLMGALFRRLLLSLREAGYEELGITWISDSNTGSLRQMEKIGARPLHRLNLFSKALCAGSDS